MKYLEQIFFELIRVSIGTQSYLTQIPSVCEWQELYKLAKKQSIVGVCFVGVQKLKKADDENATGVTAELPEMLYIKWMGMAAKIQRSNEKMDLYTQKALEHFRKEGFGCTVLKGQGVEKLYEHNVLGLRQTGDVDVWVFGGRKGLYEHSLSLHGKLEGLTYHHIHFPLFKNVEVEAHTWPSFLASPLRNMRLHKFCGIYETNDDSPSLAFNRVFILLHCYRHLCGHGVGMRQLLDYYFVLLQGFTDEEKKESMQWIDRLGMKRFACAVMWMMDKLFGLDKRYFLCEPNEEYGRFLLDEVMQTGNMGQADERVDKNQYNTAIGRYLSNLRRDIRMVKICPHEALWEPFWGFYQFTWCNVVKMINR